MTAFAPIDVRFAILLQQSHQRKESTMPVKPIPDGYHTITPYLAEYAFEPMMAPNGTIMHGELKIGDSRVMISEATEQYPAMPAMLHLYVPDVDAVHKRAMAAGGTPVSEPSDQFYGDRGGGVKDPSGNYWHIATHKEDVAPAELKKRAEAYMRQKGKAA
jgi:uncharacterized glyoxalase superfamily protein PhnB